MYYFTADQHFGSERALELSCRPFTSVDEMNYTIVNNFNSIVNPGDITIHLGDFGNFNFLKKLNGSHILILGNYEVDDMMKNFDGGFDYYQEYLKMVGFKDARQKDAYFDIDNQHVHLYLTHRPDDCLKENPSDLFNLFAHIHGRQLIKKYGIDVGVDAHHFLPINEERVLFFRNAILKGYYDSNVFN